LHQLIDCIAHDDAMCILSTLKTPLHRVYLTSNSANMGAALAKQFSMITSLQRLHPWQQSCQQLQHRQQPSGLQLQVQMPAGPIAPASAAA